jgi:hypothetical protein
MESLLLFLFFGLVTKVVGSSLPIGRLATSLSFTRRVAVSSDGGASSEMGTPAMPSSAASKVERNMEGLSMRGMAPITRRRAGSLLFQVPP